MLALQDLCALVLSTVPCALQDLCVSLHCQDCPMLCRTSVLALRTAPFVLHK